MNQTQRLYSELRNRKQSLDWQVQKRMTNVDHELRNTTFPLIMIGLRKQTRHWLNKAKHSHIIGWLETTWSSR